MLSFKELSERKTKIKINPKQSEITEKSCDSKKKCSKCEGKGCKHCGGTGYHGEEEVSEAKKKDDTYLETDFKKRQKNNEKARKDLMKGPQMKNPHFESTNQENAYDSQEEVSEESTEEVAETETFLTFGQFNERYKGKHGQSDKEYADSRSQGGKMVSGDSKRSGAEYTHGRRVKAANPGMQPDVGGKTKPKSQGKMDRGTRADLQYRKANLKKEEVELEEGRAEDAQASLAKVKARQKDLDAHEKKTGKKLDITKSPEHKEHKKNFPGAKRTGKKVKGAKETPSETHNRRVNRNVSRIVKHGYTSKEKKEVQSMAKHASRYD